MKKMISLLVVLSILAMQIATAGAAENSVNLADTALITTNIPNAETTILNIADHDYKTTFEMDGSTEPNFPYYIEFDFYNYNINLKELVLYSANGEKTGVKNIDIQYYNKKWDTLAAGVILDWSGEGEIQKRPVHCSDPVTASKIRVVINGANLVKNQFEIGEIEILGSIESAIVSKTIKQVETSYVPYPIGAGNNAALKTVISFADGTEKIMAANFNHADFGKEGIYVENASIPFYSEKAYAVFDVYDPEKENAQFKDTWCENIIALAVQNGIISGLDLTKPVSTGDFSVILQRLKKYAIVYEENKSGEELIFAAVNRNLFKDRFTPDTVLTRETAVEYIMQAVDFTGKEKIHEEKPDFQDVDNPLVDLAYSYGLIANGEAFRPNDPITFPEISLIILNCFSDGNANAAFSTEKKFVDNKKALVNPYMGIFTYYLDNGLLNYDVHYDNDDYFTDLEGVSNVYLRFPWGEIQPTKGEFDFSIVDFAIQKFASVGKQVSLRFTAAESSLNYATPKWVFDEGAKVHWWGGDSGRDNPLPYFGDPIFLQYLDLFLEQVARRYDGNPNIAYIDIGSIGIWGEGHTGSAGYVLEPDEARKHLELYHKHFKKTKIVCLDDLGHGYTDRFINDLKPDLIEYGFGLRNDGYAGIDEKMRFILEEDKTLGDGIWEQAPIVIEPEHYSEMERLDIWGDAVDLAHWIDTVHATYIGLHGYSREMYRESPAFIEYTNMRIGYRLLPEKVKLQSNAQVRETLAMDIDWKNVAAAPCYNGGYPALTLKDENNNIVSVMVDDQFNVKDLPVAAPGKAAAVTQNASFRLNPILAGGKYKAYLSVGDIDGTPEIALPIDAEEDGARRYYIGDVEIAGDYSVTATAADNLGNIKLNFDFHRTSLTPFRSAWMNIAFREVGEPTVYMPGDMYQSVEATQAFIDAVNNNGQCTVDVKLGLQDKFRKKAIENKQDFIGKKFEVYYVMDSIPLLYLSDQGRDVFLGTAEVDENLNMVFTPMPPKNS